MRFKISTSFFSVLNEFAKALSKVTRQSSQRTQSGLIEEITHYYCQEIHYTMLPIIGSFHRLSLKTIKHSLFYTLFMNLFSFIIKF